MRPTMDTVMSNLPPDVGMILMKNIGILQVVSMFAIGAYNALETGVVIFDTFKQYRGLHFWSMQVASWGILVHAIPAMVRFVSVAPNLPMSIPFILGWYAMVTGQALVLYSRLHLVVSDINKLSWVLWMIIINALTLHTPMTVLFFGLAKNYAALARPAAIFDRIQLTGFCIQDFIICGIYIREALRALSPVLEVRGKEGRKVIVHLGERTSGRTQLPPPDHRVQAPLHPSQFQNSSIQHKTETRIFGTQPSTLIDPHTTLRLPTTPTPTPRRRSTPIKRYKYLRHALHTVPATEGRYRGNARLPARRCLTPVSLCAEQYTRFPRSSPRDLIA